MTKQRVVKPGYMVRFTVEEDAVLKRKAEAAQSSVASVIRTEMGLPPMEHGGAREGSGPKPKKKARKAKGKG